MVEKVNQVAEKGQCEYQSMRPDELNTMRWSPSLYLVSGRSFEKKASDLMALHDLRQMSLIQFVPGAPRLPWDVIIMLA